MKKMKASGSFYQLVRIENGAVVDKTVIGKRDIEPLAFTTDARKLVQKDLVIISGISAKVLRDKL